MAKKKPAKTETKSEFLRKALGRNPNLDYRQINQRWTKAGHAGDISNALFYQIRAKLGIKTEWVWVKESETRSGLHTHRSYKPGLSVQDHARGQQAPHLAAGSGARLHLG